MDAQTGKEKACLEGHTDMVNSVAISKDAKFAISGSGDKIISDGKHLLATPA